MGKNDSIQKEIYIKRFNLSQSSLEKLSIFEQLLVESQKKVNLIGKSTIPNIWDRHFLDSIQLSSFINKKNQVLVDMGSGAGFPGLVLAIMFLEVGGPEVHLVEANKNKAAFLNNVQRILDINVVIHKTRIEKTEDLIADVITARALAPLSRLIGLAQSVMKPASVCLFLKGENYHQEIIEAKKKWSFKVKAIKSITSSKSKVLQITRVSALV